MSDPSASPALQTELQEALNKIQALEAELDKEKEQVLSLQRRPYQQMTFWCGDQPMFEGNAELDPFVGERTKVTQVITYLGAQLENLKYEYLMYKEKHMASCALAEAGLRELEALRASNTHQRVLSLRNMVEGLKEEVAQNTQAAIDRDMNEYDLGLARDQVHYYKERFSRVLAERDSLLKERGENVAGNTGGDNENQTYTYISTAEHESILAEVKDKYEKPKEKLEEAVTEPEKQKKSNLVLRFEMQKLLSAQRAAEEENRGDRDRLMKEVASLKKKEGVAEASKQEALAVQGEQLRQEYVEEKDNALAQEREKAETDKQALRWNSEKEKEEAVAAACAAVEREKDQVIQDLRQQVQEMSSEAASLAAAHQTALEGKAQEIESLRQQMEKAKGEKDELAAEMSEKLADAKSLETTTPSSGDQEQDYHHRHKESLLPSLSQEVFFTPATVFATPATSLAPTETPSPPRPLPPSASSTPIETPTPILLNEVPQEQEEHSHHQVPAPATAVSTAEPCPPIIESITYTYTYPHCRLTQSSLEIAERARMFKASLRARMEKTEYHARKAREAKAKGPFAQDQRRANLTPL